MKEFLLELADLMENHNISAEAVDDDADYFPAMTGVRFYQQESERALRWVNTDVEFSAVELRALAKSLRF